MVVKGSIIPAPDHGLVGFAPGYMDAMHGLCIRCHEELAQLDPGKYGEHFARCDVCHHDFADRDHRKLAPYVPMPPGHMPADEKPASRAMSLREWLENHQPTRLTVE